MISLVLCNYVNSCCYSSLLDHTCTFFFFTFFIPIITFLFYSTRNHTSCFMYIRIMSCRALVHAGLAFIVYIDTDLNQVYLLNFTETQLRWGVWHRSIGHQNRNHTTMQCLSFYNPVGVHNVWLIDYIKVLRHINTKRVIQCQNRWVL